MANTFFTSHIKNRNQESQEQFVKNLHKYFAKKGFVPATEEDAQLTYSLVFSDESDWVSISSPEYQPGEKSLNEDAEGIAKSLKTHCITASVWDSDFIELELFGSTAKQRDSVVIGRYEGLHAPKGVQKLWEPLLINGTTWGRLSEIFNGNHTFIERSLVEMAELVGMDSDSVKWDDEEDPDAVYLHLKNADKKEITLKSAFVQVFGEALEPLGFKLIKGRQPYFARVVNGEIIHVVTYQSESTYKPGIKEFGVVGGSATVYLPKIKADEFGGLFIGGIEYVKPLTKDEAITDAMEYYRNKPNVHKTVNKAVEYALGRAKEMILPELDKAVDIDSCIEYYHKNFPSAIHLNNIERIISGEVSSEGLIFTKTDKYAMLIKRNLERNRAINERNHQYSEEELKARHQRGNEVIKREISLIEKLLTTPDLSARVVAELDRRKKANIELLRAYGLDI